MVERLRELLNCTKSTQAALAEKIGVQQSTVSMWMSGQREPTEAVKRLICREYGVNYEWLAYGIEPMRPTQSDSDIVLITRAMEGQNENKKKLIRIMADMPDELLDKMMEYLESKLK